MGSILEISSRRVFPLEAETTIGRSAQSRLVLDGRLVSSLHSMVRFTPLGWEIKDLGSTNGTFVNGTRLLAGAVCALHEGDTFSFGSPENGWKLLEEAPPGAMVSSSAGAVIVAEQQMIVLPSADGPVVTIYCTAKGSWRREQASLSSDIDNGQWFDALGQRWKFSLPDSITKTDALKFKDVRSARLTFGVSSDQEDIHLRADTPGVSIDLGNRASNQLLLVLARRRLSDAESGLESANCGWLYPDDLARALATDPEHVNVDIFRVRRRFGPHFDNAAEIIERQGVSRRLRLNVENIEIRNL